MPFPPRQLPVPRPRDDHHGFGQQRECEGEREDEAGAAAAIEEDETQRGEPVQREADRREDELPAVELLGGERVVERRELGERDDRPQDHQRDKSSKERIRVPDDESCARRRKLDGRRRGKQPGHDEADRRRELESRVRPEEHRRRRERVQAEEARARDERERDEDEPCITPAARRGGHRPAERRRQRRRAEHEPEVGLLVLPVDVERGSREEQHEEDERRGDDRCERAQAHWLEIRLKPDPAADYPPPR